MLLWITAGTAAAQIAVRSALAHDHDVAPGATVQGAVEIENLTDEPAQARLRLRDYGFSHQGTNSFEEPGTNRRSNAPWVELPQSVLTLPPNQRETVAYTLRIPEQIDGSAPTGTYWSILLIEPIASTSPASTLSGSEDDQDVGVRQRTRYGVQIAAHIRANGAPKLNVLQTNLARRDSTAHLTLDVENAGSKMARPRVHLEVYTADGERALRKSASRMRIYPGTSVRFRLPLSGLSSGQYEALVLIDVEGQQMTGFQHSLEL